MGDKKDKKIQKSKVEHDAVYEHGGRHDRHHYDDEEGRDQRYEIEGELDEVQQTHLQCQLFGVSLIAVLGLWENLFTLYNFDEDHFGAVFLAVVFWLEPVI